MQNNALDDRRTFDSWATDYYEKEAISHYDRVVGNMLDLLQVSPGGKILDAGCGTGVHSIRAAKRGCAVRSVDISAIAVERAKELARQAGVAERINFGLGDLTKLAFADAEFGGVFSWGVIIHIPDVGLALAELVRVTAPGGRIALQVTNQRALDHRIEAVARLVARKPKHMQKAPIGSGAWHEMYGANLWTWRVDVGALSSMMQELGCTQVYRGVSEFTELQCRVKGPFRRALRKLNDLYFKWGLPPSLGCTNLVVFERRPF